MSSAQKLLKHRAVVFLGVGLLNTLLDFLFYTLLTTVFFPEAGEIGIVGIISGTFALVCAYTTHKLITWRDRPAARLTIIKFFVVTGFGLWVIRPLLLVWFITWEFFYKPVHTITSNIGLPFNYAFVASTGAFLFMVIIVMTYNYVTYSRLVFNDRSGTEPKIR